MKGINRGGGGQKLQREKKNLTENGVVEVEQEKMKVCVCSITS